MLQQQQQKQLQLRKRIYKGYSNRKPSPATDE
jgi:hypothetical protein